ncbi:MAG: hypothetical protein QNJ71_11260 [Acidimicrobiia bacterium]|nr:hypothetical protein [Acidimicrobiia bacterium]
MVVHLQREAGDGLEMASSAVRSRLGNEWREEGRGPFALEPGQTAGLSGLPGSGLTRLGLALLLPYAEHGQLAYLDVRGWANPAAAWEMGCDPGRLVFVRTTDVVTWGRIVATLLTGMKGIYAEVPPGVRDAVLRKLVAKARTSRTPLVLRPLNGSIPRGLAHLRLDARTIVWEGTDEGHGQLITRRSQLDASGKWARGMQRMIEVEDHGTNGLRVVPDMGAAKTRRLA